MSLVTPQHVESSKTRNRTHVPCIGRQILNHWTTREAQKSFSVQFSSVAQSCLTLCDPMNRSMPGLPVHHQLPEFTQTHVHWVGDAIQPSHPLSSPSPPAPNPSQHQSLFQWVNSSHEVAKEFLVVTNWFTIHASPWRTEWKVASYNAIKKVNYNYNDLGKFVSHISGFIVRGNAIVLSVSKNLSCNSIDNSLRLNIEGLIFLGLWDAECLETRVWNQMPTLELYCFQIL